MEQPIFELEIVDEIMYTIRKANVGFYQRELSYDHCEVSNILEGFSCFEKKERMVESLPLCNGVYLIPLFKKLRQENVTYYKYAMQILLHELYTICESVTVNPIGSVFEQLVSWLKNFIQTYQEKENHNLEESQLSVVFEFRLRSLLENYESQKQKEKVSE